MKYGNIYYKTGQNTQRKNTKTKNYILYGIFNLVSFDLKKLAREMNERLIHLRAVCPADGFALSELYIYVEMLRAA